MNLFLDANKWGDDDGSPPIWWAGSRYEILINNDGSAAGSFRISMLDPSVAGDTIKFSYEVSTWDPMLGYSDGYINIADDQSNVVASANFSDQTSGELQFECVVGRTYTVLVGYTAEDYFQGNFYDFEAILTPTPDEDPEPETSKPWWLCDPKEPVTPCPVRPTEFVSLDEYDVDFKFPLASSRPVSKIVRPEECMVCRPTLIGEPDPVDPPEVCTVMEVSPYTPTQFYESETNSNMPAWFTWGDTLSIAIRFPSISDYVYYLQWNGTEYAASSGDTFPFDNYEQVLEGEIAQPEDAEVDSFNWSCVQVSTYPPA